MKDIKPNQEGLMSLAEKRPDVVEKMGYDPDSFAAVSYTHLTLPTKA